MTDSDANQVSWRQLGVAEQGVDGAEQRAVFAEPQPEDGAGVEHPIGGDVDNEVDADPDSAIDNEPRYRDWRWVEEWRADGDRPAWAPGITLAIFMALLVAVALLVLTTGLSNVPALAIGVNVVIAAGMAPALWLSRGLPVLRFLAAGAAVGMVAGWICILIALPHWS
ncbi:MAG: DUF2537 domain-containing protein [Actinomycetota bacterium]|nr:DUF2537 domain-containing protein [Actinomycetota bacterium]